MDEEFRGQELRSKASGLVGDDPRAHGRARSVR